MYLYRTIPLDCKKTVRGKSCIHVLNQLIVHFINLERHLMAQLFDKKTYYDDIVIVSELSGESE